MNKRSRNRWTRSTRSLVRVAVIAALYAAVTLAVYPLSYGWIQVRFSEALTILPLFMPEAIPGLFIGCFLANIPNGIWDMLIGSLTSLLAAVATRALRKWYFGVVPPIVFNALTVPVILLMFPENTAPYWFYALTVGAGQAVAVLALGIPLYFGLKQLIKRHPKLMLTEPARREQHMAK